MNTSAVHRPLPMKQPPKVAARPGRSLTLRSPHQGQSAAKETIPTSSVSQLRSKLFGESSYSSATLPRPLPTKAPTPPADDPPLSDEEYDDVRNVVMTIRKTHSLKNISSYQAPPPIAPHTPQLRPPIAPSTPPPTPPRGHYSTHLITQNAAPALPPGRASPSPCPPISTEAVPLVDFMRINQKNLPLKVRIYAGTRGKDSFSDGEMLYLHCQKNSQAVIVATFGEQAANCVAPINSGVEFGILYNPEGDYNKAYQGYQFETVGHILAMPTLPTVVCAKRSSTNTSHESSVNANDILLIREVVQKSFSQACYLSCVHAKTNEPKLLPETCIGWFTTSPYEVSLHLHQIVEHLHLPLECLALYNAADAHNIRSRLPRSVLKLEKRTTEKSVVASRPSSSSDLLSIPLQLKMEVQQTQLSVDESKKLVKLTNTVFESFNSAKVHPVVPPTGPNGEGLEVLCELVNQLNPNVGIDLEMLPNIPTSKRWEIELPTQEDNEPEYDIPDVALKSFMSKMPIKNDQLVKTPEPPLTTPPSYDAIRTPSTRPTTVNVPSHYDVPTSRKYQPTTAAGNNPILCSPKPERRNTNTQEDKRSETEVVMLRKEVATLNQAVQNLQSFYQQLKEQTGISVAAISLPSIYFSCFSCRCPSGNCETAREGSRTEIINREKLIFTARSSCQP